MALDRHPRVEQTWLGFRAMTSVRELVPPQNVLPAYARDRPGDEPGGHFLKSGQRFLDAARSRGLAPHHRVLDLGCGVGRFALAAAGFLDERGSYVGIDVSRRSIKLCRAHFGSKLPNFRFVHAGLFNTEYNPRAAAQDASAYRFPFRRESFDFVFSNSLFTHLVPEATENYLLEIGRLLRPGGRAFNTMFLLNPESLAHLDAPDSPQGKTHEFGSGIARVKSLENPEAWIAFDEGFIRELHRRSGLEVQEPVRYGAWSGRQETEPGFGAKDYVVARKLPPSPPKRLYRRLRRSLRRLR
jgi:SAM-dependent methyltransferase